MQDRPLFGVGRGLANQVAYLAEAAEITLLCDERRSLPSIPGCTVVSLPGLGRLPEVAWLQVSVPRWLRQHRTIFHGPYNAVPFASRPPRVVTVHDLSWEHHAEDFSAARRAALLIQARWSVRHCDLIITVSAFTREAIIDAYGVAEDRVVVAPNAVDPVFGPERANDAAALLSSLGVKRPFVVALGGARRRALPVAVEAWSQATQTLDPRPTLVVVGGEPPPLLPGVFHVGRLDDAAWAVTLASAEAFCYPTRYEGFGMPALEAAASGTPVVCARVAALPEVLGDAAEWARTAGVEDIGAALHRVLTDAERRAALSKAGLERAAAAPTWKDSASILLDAYNGLGR